MRWVGWHRVAIIQALFALGGGDMAPCVPGTIAVDLTSCFRNAVADAAADLADALCTAYVADTQRLARAVVTGPGAAVESCQRAGRLAAVVGVVVLITGIADANGRAARV